MTGSVLIAAMRLVLRVCVQCAMASDSSASRHPFAAELTARATQIGAKLRAQQDQSDLRGCYSDEVHRELLEGGFYRILQPRMFNGGG